MAREDLRRSICNTIKHQTSVLTILGAMLALSIIVGAAMVSTALNSVCPMPEDGVEYLHAQNREGI